MNRVFRSHSWSGIIELILINWSVSNLYKIFIAFLENLCFYIIIVVHSLHSWLSKVMKVSKKAVTCLSVFVFCLSVFACFDKDWQTRKNGMEGKSEVWTARPDYKAARELLEPRHTIRFLYFWTHSYSPISDWSATVSENENSVYIPHS